MAAWSALLRRSCSVSTSSSNLKAKPPLLWEDWETKTGKLRQEGIGGDRY